MNGNGGSPEGASARYAVLIGAGVFLLQILFIGSYVGALHEPEPRDLPVAVVGPDRVTDQITRQMEKNGDLDLEKRPSEEAAREAINERDVYGAFVVGQKGDELLVADAANQFAAQIIEKEFGRLERSQNRPMDVNDIKPLPDRDSRGLSPFYSAVGWVVGGYLLATAVAIFRGPRAGDRRLAFLRIAGFAAYAVASGVAGAVLLDGVIGAFDGHGLALAAIGALVVFATAVAAGALQAAVGIVGTGLAILLFVVLGNPASGGPYAPELLPGMWRSVGLLLPPGAGTTLVRNAVYFSGNDVGAALAVLLAYAVVGMGLVLLLVRTRRDAGPVVQPEGRRSDLLLAGLLLSGVARRVEVGEASPNLVSAAAGLVPGEAGRSEEERARIAAREVIGPLGELTLLGAAGGGKGRQTPVGRTRAKDTQRRNSEDAQAEG